MIKRFKSENIQYTKTQDTDIWEANHKRAPHSTLKHYSPVPFIPQDNPLRYVFTSETRQETTAMNTYWFCLILLPLFRSKAHKNI